MIEEVARIVDLDEGYAWVETERKSACGSCSSAKGCGTSALADAFGSPKARIRVNNARKAGLGDLVIIGIPDAALTRGTLVMYGLPLLGVMLGALLSGLLPWFSDGVLYPDGYTIPGALLGLWAGFSLARRHHYKAVETRKGEGGIYEPVVLRRMDETPLVFNPDIS